jgi:hypothetical protein
MMGGDIQNLSSTRFKCNIENVDSRPGALRRIWFKCKNNMLRAIRKPSGYHEFK